MFSHKLCSPINTQLPYQQCLSAFKSPTKYEICVWLISYLSIFLYGTSCKSVFCGRSDAALILHALVKNVGGFCVPVIEIPGSPNCFFHKNRFGSPWKADTSFLLCPVIRMHVQRCKNGLVHRSAQGRSRRNLLGHSQTHSRLQFL